MHGHLNAILQLLRNHGEASALVGRIAAYKLFQTMYQTLPAADVKDVMVVIKNPVRLYFKYEFLYLNVMAVIKNPVRKHARSHLWGTSCAAFTL